MESCGRSAPHFAPHPADGQAEAGLTSHAASLVVGAGLFALILAGVILLSYRHMATATHIALTGDKTTASLLAAFIEEHNKATMASLKATAGRKRFIAAVKSRDSAEAGVYLETLQSSADIDLTFITDPQGILWLNSPYFPEAIGKDLSHREWYKGLSGQWQPYISSVFNLIVADKPLAVAVSVPVYDEEEIVGILSSSQRLDFIRKTIEGLPLIPDSLISIIDQSGQMLYSTNYPYRDQPAKHPLAADLSVALKEKQLQLTLTGQGYGGDQKYLTLVPVAESGWSVIVERSRNGIFKAEMRHFRDLGLTALLVYSLGMVFFAYRKKASLVKKTARLLQTEQQLRALSARQEAILAAVPEIIMEVDGNHVYTWANTVGLEFFGADVLGKEASCYFAGEQDTYEQVKDLFQGTGEKIYVESWQRRRDGEKRLLAWWCRVIKDDAGKVRGVLSSAYDITEKKLAEDKFRHIFDASVTGISITLPSGEVDVNLAFATMLGYSREELNRKHWQEISHPDDIESTRQAIAPLLSGKEDSARFSKRYLHKNGYIVWAEVGTTLRRDIDDKPMYFITSINDISERKKAEEERRLFTEELARSNTDLQQFAYAASHDLQEPLRMVSSYLQLIERRYKEKLDDDADTFIRYAVDGANRMQALIAGLLEYSRINTQGQAFVPVDTSHVLDGVCGNLHSLIVESGAVIRYGTMPVIEADEVQIARLFQNLLQNALKFRREGVPPIIDISTERSDAHQVFSVCDNGIGIESRYFERIFTIFQRLHTREQYPGTGMGLAICKRIVERHGGKIWLRSNTDAGTTFYFSIPGGIQ